MNGGTYQTMLGRLINVRERYELFDIKLDKYERKNLANDKKFKKISAITGFRYYCGTISIFLV